MSEGTIMEVELIEELRLLVEAQGIDLEINEINRRKSGMPAMVARVSGPYEEAQVKYNAAKKDYEAADAEKVTVEQGIEESKDLLVKLKLRSTEIKTNKEYFAHLKEIEECEKRIASLEDRSLELMESLETLKGEFDGASEELEAAEKEFEEEKKKVEDSFEGDNRRLDELGARREDVLAKLPKAHRDYYQRMVDKYPENAVARAEGGACTGCRMMIPPQAFNNVRKGEVVTSCNNCKRILYYDGESE